MSKTYRIGVKQYFWFRKFTVTEHWTETVLVSRSGEDVRYQDIKPRLCLRLEDGSVQIIPDIVNREWKVYPEFNEGGPNGE
jgi:hypothetical protein